MSHTPEQACKLWCPMARATSGSDEAGNCGNTPPFRIPTYARCVSLNCAMWRWEHTTKSVPSKTLGMGGEPVNTFDVKVVQTHGYCGLAGSPIGATT